MKSSQAQMYSARLQKLSLPKFTEEFYQAMGWNLKGVDPWKYEACAAEDERRGNKAHAKALEKLHNALGIKVVAPGVLDLRGAS